MPSKSDVLMSPQLSPQSAAMSYCPPEGRRPHGGKAPPSLLGGRAELRHQLSDARVILLPPPAIPIRNGHLPPIGFASWGGGTDQHACFSFPLRPFLSGMATSPLSASPHGEE